MQVSVVMHAITFKKFYRDIDNAPPNSQRDTPAEVGPWGLRAAALAGRRLTLTFSPVSGVLPSPTEWTDSNRHADPHQGAVSPQQNMRPEHRFSRQSCPTLYVAHSL